MKYDRKVSKIQARLMFEVLRETRDLTYAVISRRSGVSAITISRWCKDKRHGGVRHHRLDTLLKIAICVGLDLQVVGAEPEPRRGTKHDSLGQAAPH